MASLSEVFGQADHERVNQAIQEAESATGAEIVPVIAGSSGRYDRPEDIVGLWLALIALAIVWILFPVPNPAPGSWERPAPRWQLAALLASAVIGFVAGAIIGSRVDWLRRLFTPQRQMREEVDRRARGIFFDQRVHHTQGASGVLLYISLFERMACVIADRSVIESIGEEQIEIVCREFTDRLHNGSPIDAICETAKSVGRRLTEVLPRPVDDVNEKPDALVVIE